MKKQEIFKAFIKECEQKFGFNQLTNDEPFLYLNENYYRTGEFTVLIRCLQGDLYIHFEVESDTDNGIDFYYKNLEVSKIEFFDIEGNDFETIEPLVTQVEMNKLIIEFLEEIKLWRDEVTEHHIHRNER